MKRLMLTVTMLATLSGCSNEGGEKVKAILECSMASKLVGRVESIDAFADYTNIIVAKYKLKIKVSEVQAMHDEIKAEWNLKSMSRHDQDVLLVNVYNSSFCASIHLQRKIDVEDVPEG